MDKSQLSTQDLCKLQQHTSKVQKKGKLVQKARDIIKAQDKRHNSNVLIKTESEPQFNYKTLNNKSSSLLKAKSKYFGRNTDYFTSNFNRENNQMDFDSDYFEKECKYFKTNHILNQELSNPFVSLKDSNLKEKEEPDRLQSTVNHIAAKYPESYSSFKNNLFGVRTRSEQRTQTKIDMPLYSIQFDERHSNKAKTQQCAKDMLKELIEKAEALSDCEISNSCTESSEEQIHQTAQLSINNKPDELSGPQIFDSQIRKDKVIKDDTLEYTMSVNESHGGHTTGSFGGTFSNFKFGNQSQKNT